jgi:hypothetical protein
MARIYWRIVYFYRWLPKIMGRVLIEEEMLPRRDRMCWQRMGWVVARVAAWWASFDIILK